MGYKIDFTDSALQDIQNLKKSEKESKTTVSIPMHEELTEKDIDKVIKLVNG